MLKPIILFFTPNARPDQYFYKYEPVKVEEEPLPDHLHPLLIPLVISKIVSQLEVKDLLNFRLVCRSWNAEATPALRKGIRHLKILPCGMRDFLRVYRRTQEPPVQSFSFHVENTEHMILLKGVSESLGHFVTSLRLSIASQELPSLPKILQNFRALTEFQLLRVPEKCLPPAYRKYETLDDDLCLPHLTSICFGSRFPNLPFICNYDNFICEIINSSEKLETLEFQNWKSSLQHIFKFSELNSLRVLSLSGTSIKESEMATLTRKRLKLRQLKITLGQSLREETLTNFFESISDSLQVLDVASDKAGSNFHINSDLPELKVLRFQGPKCKIILDDFTANFPQLETVEFLDFEFIAFTDYRRKEKSLVKTLIARPCNKGDELAEVNIASLVAAFPNVTHFHGSYFNDSMCDAIFKYWRHLQALWLSSADNVTDFGITGVPNEILKTTKNVTCFCSNTMTEFGDSRINNHIGNLSGLKSLALQGGSFTPALFLYGIYHLKTLTDLSINQDVIPLLCFECLQTQLPNLRLLHIDSCDQDLFGPLHLAYVRSQMPRVQVYLTNNYNDRCIV